MRRIRFQPAAARHPRPRLWVVLALTQAISATAAETLLVRHNFFQDDAAHSLNYKGEVLELLLEKSKAKYGPYVMYRGEQQTWNQRRAYNRLEHGDLDLIASQTTIEREKSGLPVRYCLYKGLLGVRIGMGDPATVARLNHIQTREELNQITLGQVVDWPDYTIQSEAGLQVTPLTSVAASIQRLKIGSFQLLPLGIVEVEPIARQYGLATISNWAITYPTAYYFFVSKKRPELAQRLEYGFEQAIKDHSFDQLFAKRIEPLIAGSGLAKRRLFRIPNPLLPAETPLARKELWHPLVRTGLQ